MTTYAELAERFGWEEEKKPDEESGEVDETPVKKPKKK
jgi:hypothetical protein